MSINDKIKASANDIEASCRLRPENSPVTTP